MLRDDIMTVKNEMENLKQDLKSDSNSVYLLTKEKNKYFIILVIVFVVFISFLLFNSFYLYGKIDSINSKLDLMINAKDEYLDYEENIEVNSDDGGNANYIEGNYGEYNERYNDYGRRGVDSRYRGYGHLDRMYNEYGNYSYGRERYGANSEETKRGLKYMLESMEDFARMLKEEAGSQEEVEMIRQTAQRIAQM